MLSSDALALAAGYNSSDEHVPGVEYGVEPTLTVQPAENLYEQEVLTDAMHLLL